MTATWSPATITPAMGVGPGGRIIRRGFRAHCPECGYLSPVTGYRTAGRRVTNHRCPRP